MTGDTADIATRLRRLLPARWFSDASPVRDAVLAALASPLATVFVLLGYVRLQTRIATSTGVWLDGRAADFLGSSVSRRLGESDAVFAARFSREVFRARVTRPAMIAAVIDLTGNVPAVFEPWNAGDTGGYGNGAPVWTGMAYGAAGAWGALNLPAQSFMRLARPLLTLPGAGGGYGSSIGGYGVGATQWNDGTPIPASITDAEIFATIARTAAEGTVVWASLSGARLPGLLITDVGTLDSDYLA